MKRVTVGVGVDSTLDFGRQILLGVLRYANLKRNWLIMEDLQVLATEPRRWPRCEGIIVSTSKTSTLKELGRRCRELICCSGNADSSNTNVVCLDDVTIGHMAAEHLIHCRRRHFAFYGAPGGAVSGQRFAGFCATLADAGFACENSPIPYHWEPHPYGPERPEQARLLEWLHALPKPVGIFAMDDSAARGLATACLQSGIGVPDQVAIIGVNNDELLCQTSWPTLSSVDAGLDRVGFAAAKMLDRLLAGEDLPAEERAVRFAPAGVVRRKSTEVLAEDDPMVTAAVRFIHEHACAPCSVSDVLLHVPVNRRWLERQFANRPDLHGTPHDEIMHVRMEAACRMLRQPSLTLDEIARGCGFGTTGSFSRAFSQRMGTSPGAYRKQRIGSKPSAGGGSSGQ